MNSRKEGRMMWSAVSGVHKDVQIMVFIYVQNSQSPALTPILLLFQHEEIRITQSSPSLHPFSFLPATCTAQEGEGQHLQPHSHTCIVACDSVWTRDDREWLFTFLFLPIPIPKQSFNRCGINIFDVSKTQRHNIIVLSLSLNLTDDFSHYCVMCVYWYV